MMKIFTETFIYLRTYSMPTDRFIYFLCNDQIAIFWGLGPRGVMTWKFKLSRDFLIMHLPTKFHHPMFNHSEVVMLTNKQTFKQANKQTNPKNIQLASLCYIGRQQNLLNWFCSHTDNSVFHKNFWQYI